MGGKGKPQPLSLSPNLVGTKQNQLVNHLGLGAWTLPLTR